MNRSWIAGHLPSMADIASRFFAVQGKQIITNADALIQLPQFPGGLIWILQFASGRSEMICNNFSLSVSRFDKIRISSRALGLRFWDSSKIRTMVFPWLRPVDSFNCSSNSLLDSRLGTSPRSR